MSVKGGTGIELFRVALRAFFPPLALVKIRSDQISIIRTVGGNTALIWADMNVIGGDCFMLLKANKRETRCVRMNGKDSVNLFSSPEFRFATKL